MNVETGTEAALFPEKEYIDGIFLAVHHLTRRRVCPHLWFRGVHICLRERGMGVETRFDEGTDTLALCVL